MCMCACTQPTPPCVSRSAPRIDTNHSGTWWRRHSAHILQRSTASSAFSRCCAHGRGCARAGRRYGRPSVTVRSPTWLPSTVLASGKPLRGSLAVHPPPPCTAGGPWCSRRCTRRRERAHGRPRRTRSSRRRSSCAASGGFWWLAWFLAGPTRSAGSATAMCSTPRSSACTCWVGCAAAGTA